MTAVLACSLALAGCGSPDDDAPAGPSHVVVSPGADAATEQSLTWRADGDAAAQALRVTGPDGAVPASVEGKGRAQERYSGTDVPAWTARLDSLTPDTRYAYTLGTGADAVRGTFRTAAADLTQPWSFLEVGDTQVDNAGVPADIIAQAVRDHPDARLLLHAGDVVDDPTEGQEWDDLFTALAPARGLGLLVAIGNHEQCVLMKCESGDRQAFTDAFTFPGNGAAGQRPTWYRVDQQGVRFIVLDTFGGDLPAQRRFLQDSLSDNPMRWTVVLLHQGPFASREDRSSTDVFFDLWPVMKRGGVDLVLAGHDHSYDRGYEGDPTGPVVVTANGGPKRYEPSDVDWSRRGATRVRWASGISTYQVVDVSRDELRLRAVVGWVGERAKPQGLRAGDTLDEVVIPH